MITGLVKKKGKEKGRELSRRAEHSPRSHSLPYSLSLSRERERKGKGESDPATSRVVSLQKGTNQPATRMSLNRSQRSCRSTKYGTQAKT
jgi:hypothetical protein